MQRRNQGISILYKTICTVEPALKTHKLRIKLTDQELTNFKKNYMEGPDHRKLIYPNAYTKDKSEADIVSIIEVKVTKEEYDKFDPNEENIINGNNGDTDDGTSNKVKIKTLQDAAQYIYDKVKTESDLGESAIYYIVDIEIKPNLKSEYTLLFNQLYVDTFNRVLKLGDTVPVVDPIDQQEVSSRIVNVTVTKEYPKEEIERSDSYGHNGDLARVTLDYIFDKMDNEPQEDSDEERLG